MYIKLHVGRPVESVVIHLHMQSCRSSQLGACDFEGADGRKAGREGGGGGGGGKQMDPSRTVVVVIVGTKVVSVSLRVKGCLRYRCPQANLIDAFDSARIQSTLPPPPFS